MRRYINRHLISGMTVRATQLATATALLCSLCACSAGLRSWQQGQEQLRRGDIDSGLASLQQAVSLEPQNPQYRAALISSRAAAIQQYLISGDAALRGGQLQLAEAAYHKVQELDSDNDLARRGVQAVAVARRHLELLTEAETLVQSGTTEALQEARVKIRKVLRQEPEHTAARKLRQRIDTLLQGEQSPSTEPVLSERFDEHISLEFRDAPFKSILQVIAKVSGLNFLYDKDVPQQLKSTIFVHGVSIRDAIRLLLITSGLRYRVLNENSILIYPNSQGKIEEYQSLVVRTFYLENAGVEEVARSIRSIVKSQDLVEDARLGLIVMRDTPDAVRMAERIVALQDLGDPEVVLELEILEIQRSRLQALGVQWPSQLTLSPVQGDELTLRALGNITTATIRAGIGDLTLNLRQEDQDVNILANPRIRVRNRGKANIQIGDRVPVITATTTPTGTVSDSVSYADVGLKLEAVPNIHLNGEVTIRLTMEVSSLVREIVSASGTLSYQIGTRMASTALRLEDGETQILAGLINDEDRKTANKVPILGELPVARRLFGSHRDNGRRSEILLSVTPRIVRALHRPELPNAGFEFGTARHVGEGYFTLSPPGKWLGDEATDPAAAAPESATDQNQPEQTDWRESGNAPGVVDPVNKLSPMQ